MGGVLVMINISGNLFAKNDGEFIDSLFNHGGTCLGFYKVMSNGAIRLFDQQNNIRAYIVNNKHNEQFFVSASKIDSKIFYSYSLCDRESEWLGVIDLGYMELINLAKKLIKGDK